MATFEILQNEDQVKVVEKWGQLQGAIYAATQIPTSANQPAHKVQWSGNLLVQSAAAQLPVQPNSGNFSKESQNGLFLRFFKRETKEKLQKKNEAKFRVQFKS